MANEAKNEVMKDHSVRFPEELWKEIGKMLGVADLKNHNEFIREAVRFYIEYLKKPEEFRMLSGELESVLRSTVRDSEGRINRLLYKLSVDVAFLSLLTGNRYGFSVEELNDYYDAAGEWIRATNGTVNAHRVLASTQEEEN